VTLIFISLCSAIPNNQTYIKWLPVLCDHFSNVSLEGHMTLTNMAAIGNSCFWLEESYTEPSKGASYQISINLAKWLREDFFELANHKQELPMAAILVVWWARIW
jgi:hypothetical protein